MPMTSLGTLQNVYANMEGNVLVHISAPALGLSSMHWAVVSWGQSQLTRESVYDAKYIYRCVRSSSHSSDSHFLHLLTASPPMRVCLIKWYVLMLPAWLDMQKGQALFAASDLCLRHASKRCCAAVRALDT